MTMTTLGTGAALADAGCLSLSPEYSFARVVGDGIHMVHGSVNNV